MEKENYKEDIVEKRVDRILPYLVTKLKLSLNRTVTEQRRDSRLDGREEKVHETIF